MGTFQQGQERRVLRRPRGSGIRVGNAPVAAVLVGLLAAVGTAGCTPSPAPPITTVPGGPAATTAAGASVQLSLVARIAPGLALPWSIAPLPDGTALVSERATADIQLIRNGKATVVGKVPGVVPGGEGGLLGLAVAPTFATDHYLYAYYTAAADNRVVRMTYVDGRLGPQHVLLSGIAKANNHDGGRIKFGPDGNLYIGTGDALRPDSAQDRSSLNGKILRITAEGEPAPGNPFGTAVYSYGHRNVQGLAWDAQGRLWASEFGPDVDDELNLIRPGGNYGWPLVTGAPGRPGFVDAKVVWPSTANASPSGLAIADGVAYLSALRGERMWAVPLVGTTPAQPRDFFDGRFGRLRDVVALPRTASTASGGQDLWVLTNRGSEDQILVFSATR